MTDQLPSATSELELRLLKRELIKLDQGTWREFIALLERPATVHPRLQRLLNEPSILDHYERD